MALSTVMQGLSRRDDLPARGASDGTYNSDVNAYILPPLIGLPYSDMRQNGANTRSLANKEEERVQEEFQRHDQRKLTLYLELI